MILRDQYIKKPANQADSRAGCIALAGVRLSLSASLVVRTLCRAVNATIMIHVVLAVMFLPVDAAALHVLGMMQACAFAIGYCAIRFGAVF